MKSIALLLFAVSYLGAQTCSHALTYYQGTGSAVLVYRNGQLLKQGSDYSLAGKTVTHAYWYPTDAFSVVYAHVLSATIPNTTYAFNMLSPLREDYSCPGSKDPTSAKGVLSYDQTTHDVLGTGFIAVSSPGSARKITLDTAYVLYRGLAPPGPGHCGAGTDSLSVDPGNPSGLPQYLYVCVPTPDNTDFVWARFGAAQTAWSTNSVTLAFDPANPPTGVQWTLVYDPSLISSVTELVGPAAVAAGRNMSCGVPAQNSVTCLVVLPQSFPQIALADGVIATIQPVLTNSSKLLDPSMFAVTNVVGVGADGSAVTVMIGVR